MGTSPHIDTDKFPAQASRVGRKVNVCFHYDTSRPICGVVVRDDISEPFVGIIRLDDGRHVLMTECQFQEQ
jgi:hypothetical protein